MLLKTSNRLNIYHLWFGVIHKHTSARNRSIHCLSLYLSSWPNWDECIHNCNSFRMSSIHPSDDPPTRDSLAYEPQVLLLFYTFASWSSTSQLRSQALHDTCLPHHWLIWHLSSFSLIKSRIYMCSGQTVSPSISLYYFNELPKTSNFPWRFCSAISPEWRDLITVRYDRSRTKSGKANLIRNRL